MKKAMKIFFFLILLSGGFIAFYYYLNNDSAKADKKMKLPYINLKVL